jgi:hypothetical protein
MLCESRNQLQPLLPVLLKTIVTSPFHMFLGFSNDRFRIESKPNSVGLNTKDTYHKVIKSDI